MAVNYADFRDIAIEDYDAVVVGSGFAGAVSARQLAEEGGLRVLVIEKRAHIAGNMYDEYDEAGVLVHRYGPHIFHTNDQRAYDYLARFTEWSSYQHRVLADWYGTYMPVPFNKNSMEIAFGDEKAARLIEKLVDTFGDERKVTINELRAQEDPELQEVADFVYQNVFLYYTQKQWGLTPEEVDPSVTARVPVFISRDNRYFQDAFQGMPIDGYTRLFENLLGHEKITVCLGTEAESVFDLVFAGREDQSVNEKVMMGRMDQQLRVTRQMIDNVDPQAVRNRHLRHYLRNYLSMMMCICSVFLRMRGGETDEQDLKDIWAYLKEQNPSLYRRVRSNALNLATNLPTEAGEKIGLKGYQIAQKIFKFN